MVFRLEDTEKANELFADWQETLIWSCLQKVMGSIYVENLDNPQSAMAVIGDFCALAGKPLKGLILHKPAFHNPDFIIMVPQNEQWSDLIVSCYGDKAKRINRYAFHKEADVFDKAALLQAVDTLPSEYTIRMIDEELFSLCREKEWSSDLVSQYTDYSMYERMGLGAVILKDGEIVSGASSYTRYKTGIEIEVDTKSEYQRKGLAYVCSAKLILECLKRNLYPSWDAHNLGSVALAEKLGYHLSHEYTAFEVFLTSVMWNADIYDRYGKERIQPSIDLTHRISDKKFKRILDVGCGTGMSTAALINIWKDAEIIGVDLSEEMLQRARETIPSVSFIQRDCSKSLSDMGTFDLIFSNAFLQWIPNQEEFIMSAFDMLNSGGVFAAQIPLFEEMPANRCIIKAESVLPDKFNNTNNKFTLHSASEYYNMISKSTEQISIWITDYCHEMNNHTGILDFLKGAALRPYVDRLSEEEQKVFMAEVLKNIKKAYSYQENGKVLFPFKRLFLIGEKK